MAYGLNKALSSYIDMNKERLNPAGEGVAEPEKKVYPKVNLKEAMDEIEQSVKRIDRFVKRDLEKIAKLDIKMSGI
jgi:hypothetical protein